MTRRNTPADFWRHVDKSGDCWLWTGGRNKKGYGKFAINWKIVRAHRFSYELHHGAIPPGQHVLHECDNPPCVNPDHLFLGTNRANVDDKVAKNRQSSGSKHALSKLTELDVLAIRDKFKKGARQSDLAREHGLHRSTVSKIVLRETWRHI